MSTQEIVETPAKPLKGKYDGRGKYKRTDLHKRAIANNSPKPRWLKNLSVNESLHVLQELNTKATAAQIYALAFERGLLELCWRIRQDVECRLLGRPFVAINPDEKPKPVSQDNRLQMAVQNLILPACEAQQTKRKAKKQKQLADASSAAATTIEASPVESAT